MAVASEAHAPQIPDREAAIRQYAPLVKYVVGRLAIGLPRSSITRIFSATARSASSRHSIASMAPGVKFETYAISRIRGSIIDALRSSIASALRPPEGQETRGHHLELTAANGREPTDAEIAELMGMTMEQYNQTLVDTSG